MTDIQQLLLGVQARSMPENCPVFTGDRELFEIHKFEPVNFDFSQWMRGIDCPGIYLIADFYVGMSYGIKKRMKHHLGLYRRRQHTKEFHSFLDKYKGRKIPVFYLTDDTSQEYNCLAACLRLNFPMINDPLRCNGYEFVAKQNHIQNAIDFLKANGYTVTKTQI